MGNSQAVGKSSRARASATDSQRVRLLVSVRTLAEARVARDAGADWIDVKEPNGGPLGRADSSVIAEISQEIGTACPVSAALGELLDFQPCDLSDVTSLGLRTVKFGLAGCGRRDDWQAIWRAVQAAPQCATRITPVVYADHQSAGAPDIDEVLELALASAAPLILIDTFDKQQGNLLSHFTIEELGSIIARFRKAGIETALAGSLTADDFERLLPLRPHLLAVRTAACDAGRLGSVSFERVASLESLLHNS